MSFLEQTSAITETAQLLALDAEEFIYEAYLCVLNREPDPEGLAFNVDLLRRKSKVKILRDLRNSPEGLEKTPRIPDLDNMLKTYDQSRKRFIGTFFWWLFKRRYLRKHDQEITNWQIQRQLNSIRSTLKEEMTQFQNKVLLLSKAKELSPSKGTLEGEALKRLTPHARDMYTRLKFSITNRQK